MRNDGALTIGITCLICLAVASDWPGGDRGARGVNIHWGDWSSNDPFPAEGLDMIASYANVVRTSLQWDKTEPEQGVYNWTYLDGVMEELYSQRNVSVLFILGLWNRAYCPDLPRSTWPSCSPTEQWQVDAFVKWAVTGVGRYRARYPGSRFVAEIWNEPNIAFWRNSTGQPAPNVTQYAHLALSTARALKAAFPDQLIVGPCAAGMPIEFMQDFGAAGGFDPALFDGASFHPYRVSPPENMPASYDEFAAVVQKHTPEGKAPIPLVTSEQGWTTCGTEGPGHGTCFPRGQLATEWQQAAYVPRRYAIDEWYGVPVSIDYEFRDGGDNVTMREQMYGKVRHDVVPGSGGQSLGSGTFEAKPSFYGVQAYSKLARAPGVQLKGRLSGVQSAGTWTEAGTNAWVMKFEPDSAGASTAQRSGDAGTAAGAGAGGDQALVGGVDDPKVGLLMGWVTGDASQCSAVAKEDRRNCGNMPAGAASKETCEKVLGCCYEPDPGASPYQCFFPKEMDGLPAKFDPLASAVPSWQQWKEQALLLPEERGVHAGGRGAQEGGRGAQEGGRGAQEGGRGVHAGGRGAQEGGRGASGGSCWQPLDWMGTPVGREACTGTDGMLEVQLGANVTYFARTS